MKKLGMLVLGIVLFTGTIGGVYAATEAKIIPRVSIESKAETLKQYVADEKITQEKADDILEQLENCDGTGNSKIGQTNGISFGNGSGNGQGKNQGMSQGKGLRKMNCANCSIEK